MSSPNGFYKLKVDRITRQTEDAVSIRFLVPPPLSERFKYKAGQYLTLHFMINGEDVRRSYSVCESPYADSMPSVAVKEVEGGRMSTYLNRSLKEGDLVDAMPPMGNFTVEPNADESRNLVLFGGGSGITPLKSILLTILENEPKSNIILFYANKNVESIIFRKELDALAEKYPDRFKLIHILDTAPSGWSGLTGMLSVQKVQQLIKTHVKQPNPAFYICGPGGLMEMIKESLLGMSIPEDKINIEYFSAVKKEVDSSLNSAEIVEDGEIKERQVTIDVYGDVQTIKVKPNQTILEAAQEEGMDPPFSCTVGVCTTCRAKVNAGRVTMDEREGLSDAEIEEGYILTCQAHPTSDGVDLTFE